MRTCCEYHSWYDSGNPFDFVARGTMNPCSSRDGTVGDPLVIEPLVTPRARLERFISRLSRPGGTLAMEQDLRILATILADLLPPQEDGK